MNTTEYCFTFLKFSSLDRMNLIAISMIFAQTGENFIICYRFMKFAPCSLEFEENLDVLKS